MIHAIAEIPMIHTIAVTIMRRIGQITGRLHNLHLQFVSTSFSMLSRLFLFSGLCDFTRLTNQSTRLVIKLICSFDFTVTHVNARHGSSKQCECEKTFAGVHYFDHLRVTKPNMNMSAHQKRMVLSSGFILLTDSRHGM